MTRRRATADRPVSRRRPRRACDAGNGTVWALAVAFVILVLGGVVVMRCAAVVARHRAETAADFAALAAAARALGGREAACSAAADIARANGAVLSQCQVDGAVVAVEVAAPVARLLPGNWRAHARARAGPA